MKLKDKYEINVTISQRRRCVHHSLPGHSRNKIHIYTPLLNHLYPKNTLIYLFYCNINTHTYTQ